MVGFHKYWAFLSEILAKLGERRGNKKMSRERSHLDDTRGWARA
jgi:hypothetical protein